MSMCKRWLRVLASLPVSLLVACAHPPAAVPQEAAAVLPALRLPPSQLAQEFSLQQRLAASRLDRADAQPQVVDVQLELDRTRLGLAGFALGQRVLRMEWDGRDLQVQRHPRLPAQVDVERMLRDMTLLYWPADAIRAALPVPWTLEERGQERRLLEGAALRLRLTWSGTLAADSRVEIFNLVEGYRLDIESHLAEAAP